MQSILFRLMLFHPTDQTWPFHYVVKKLNSNNSIMETIESIVGEGEGEEGVANQSIPRGGPIYVENLVGPLTRVPDFEDVVLQELQSLKGELCSDSFEPCNDDEILVDELKVFSDEELVDMALKETFKDEQENGNCAQASEEHTSYGCNGTSNSSTRKTKIGKANKHTTTMVNNTSTKRKRRNANKHDVDEIYLAKVNELVKIKQKQDQDKAKVRLHSLNASCKINGSVIPSSERIERMKSLWSINSGKQVKSSAIQEYIHVQHSEVVLFVELYRNRKKLEKTQEFLVLGRQTLTEMRDKIYCLTDQVMHKAGRYDPSGYFLIEDLFCNDLRNPSAIDYSEPIFDWLRNSKDEAFRKWECITSGELQQKQKAVVGEVTTPYLPQFRRVNMHKARFCDIRFRLGAGYLYCHQGDCKHTIVIRDMRLIHQEDVQNRVAYPMVFQQKFRIQKCSVCKIYRATKVTVDDKWTPDNPCYFCNDCYYLLHHAEDGSLLYGDFSAYDYLHD